MTQETNRVMHALSAGVLLALVGLGSADAAPVYATAVTIPGDLTGSRFLADGGLAGFVNNANPTASVSWSIASVSATEYKYTYTFSHNSAQPGLSHIIIDLSDNCTAAGLCFNSAQFGANNATADFGSFSSAGPGASNPLLPSAIQGVKLTPSATVNFNPFTFSFVSNRVPVWGDIYLKQGNPDSNGAAIWNSGNPLHGSSENTNQFVVVPDTGVNTCTHPNCGGPGPNDEVPVPATLLLLGSGLIALGAMRRRKW